MEYPKAFDKDNGDTPYYPIANDESAGIYQKYVSKCQKFNNLYLVGRLAQYKYFNMDLVINESLKLYEQLKEEN